MRLFRSIASTKDERVFLDLCDQGMIPLITGLIAYWLFVRRYLDVLFSHLGYMRRLLQEKSEYIDYVDADILCDGLFILSCVAELDVHRKVYQIDSVLIRQRYFLCSGNLRLGRD